MNTPAQAVSQWEKALVVFSGKADLAWLRLLRPGFRHCFVVLGSKGGWISINPMAHHTDITVLPVTTGFDLARWYCDQGLIVIETKPASPARKILGWRPYSCVEEVKRIIGINSGLILTPWQLYRFLAKKGNYSLTHPGQIT